MGSEQSYFGRRKGTWRGSSGAGSVPPGASPEQARAAGSRQAGGGWARPQGRGASSPEALSCLSVPRPSLPSPPLFSDMDKEGLCHAGSPGRAAGSLPMNCEIQTLLCPTASLSLRSSAVGMPSWVKCLTLDRDLPSRETLAGQKCPFLGPRQTYVTAFL